MAQSDLWLRGGTAASKAHLRRASPSDYVKYSGVELFVKDILGQLLEQRPAQAQEVLLAFLERVVKGKQCVGRDFSFASASPRNVLAFIWAVDDAFSNFRRNDELMFSIADFHQTLLLLCPDLPLELVEKPAKALQDAQLFEKAYDYDSLCDAFFIFLYFRKAMPSLQARFAALTSGDTLSVEDVIESACEGLAKSASHLSLGGQESQESLVSPLLEHWRRPLTKEFGATGCGNREEALSCILKCQDISNTLRTRPPQQNPRIPDSALLELFQAAQPQGDGAEFEEDDNTDNSEGGGPISLMSWEARMGRRYKNPGGRGRKQSMRRNVMPMRKTTRQKSKARGSMK